MQDSEKEIHGHYVICLKANSGQNAQIGQVECGAKAQNTQTGSE